MYTIRKQFTFSAAHHLNGLDDGHPCARQHGHNYIVEVVLSGSNVTDKGFIVDYRELDYFKRWLDTNYDHRDLNEVLPKLQTSAENLARHFYTFCKGRWPQTKMVRVSETPKTWAEYTSGV
jgi:6-pyruvoyltetrahydropterin/6-carboxytetrahydropterin synthase